MLFFTALSALALISDSVLAATPPLIEKDTGSKWALPWAEKQAYKHAYPPAYSYAARPSLLSTASSVFLQTGGAPFPTATGLVSGTGMLGTGTGIGTAYSSTSSATSSYTFACPNDTIIVTYITVTASVTSTSFVLFTATGGTSGFPSSSANSTGIYTLSRWNATATSKPAAYITVTTTYSESLSSSTASSFNETTSSAFNATSSVLLNVTSSTLIVTSSAYTNTSSTIPTSIPTSNSSTVFNSTSSTAVVTSTSTIYANTSSALPTSTPCSTSTQETNGTSSVYNNTSSVPTSTALNSTTSLASTTSISSTSTSLDSTISVNISTTRTYTATRSIEIFTVSTSTFTVTTAPTPITINTGTDLHPTTSYTPTTVVTFQATGTPNPKALHCGLHGLPVGDYFLAEFVEEKANVAVTLEGCYQFCVGVYGIDMGCESYSFFPEVGTGAPRCDLYGGSVAQSLDSINDYVPNVWYDLGCGNPLVI
ncbi:hypothetical protein BP6252_09198 [Coleophoma cylindrospora]|uniref:Apple domain-containing protein n=1 Tax=Coleophoma cylindrospora TaxID=1849047 RepID=A0A3D8R184_9HELO|nr:hypothetical protein BP6252_09198 [Coleophoma cylindrospora]